MVSPYAEDRDMAYEIIGKDRCIEVYVSTPLEICESAIPKAFMPGLGAAQTHS
jgi:adenylylsulfate kinase